jgi:hypothetical protein
MTAQTPPISTLGTRPNQTSAARLYRAGLLTLQAFVGATALGGGVTLIVGALNPRVSTVLTPPVTYLSDTPFSSYLVPGLLLAGIVGGTHVAALVLTLRRHSWSVFASAGAAFALLILVFVQMVFIPFSFLQAVYFAAGIAEVGLVMLALGITRSRTRASGEEPTSSRVLA